MGGGSMSFFGKLKDRLFKTSSKLDEGLSDIVGEGTPEAAPGFLACFDALLEAYMTGVVWEPRRVFEGRVAALLPGLFLARIDGKSPVEYVTDETDKEKVRRVAVLFLLGPAATLSEMRAAWSAELSL